MLSRNMKGIYAVRAFNAVMRKRSVVEGVDAVDAVLCDMEQTGVRPDVATWTFVKTIGERYERKDLVHRARHEIAVLHGAIDEIEGSKASDQDDQELKEMDALKQHAEAQRQHWESGFYAMANEEGDEW